MTGEQRDLQKKYRFLFENSGDMIFALDRNGIITSFNRAAELTSGYGREEMIGKSFAKILAVEGTKQLELKWFRKRLNTRESKGFQAVMRTQSGEPGNSWPAVGWATGCTTIRTV